MQSHIFYLFLFLGIFTSCRIPTSSSALKVNSEPEIIKLAYWPTFEAPFEVTVSHRGIAPILELQRYSGEGGFNSRVNGQPTIHPLEERTWRKLHDLLTSSRFSKLPRQNTLPPSLDATGITISISSPNRIEKKQRCSGQYSKDEMAFWKPFELLYAEAERALVETTPEQH